MTTATATATGTTGTGSVSASVPLSHSLRSRIRPISAGMDSGVSMDWSSSGESDDVSDTQNSVIMYHQSLAAKESRAICYLRGTVFTLMLMATIAFSTAIYSLASRQEEDGFETQFESYTMQLWERSESKLAVLIGALEMLAMSYTSYADDRQRDWPKVTLPHFASKASVTRDVAEALAIGYAPKVIAEDRGGWESYSDVNREEWIRDSEEIEKQSVTRSKTIGFVEEGEKEGIVDEIGNDAENFPKYTDGVSRNIFEMKSIITSNHTRYTYPQIDDSSGPYFPIWQNSPLVRGLINYNMVSDKQFQDAVNTCLQSQQVVLGGLNDIGQNDYFKQTVYPIWNSTQSDINYADEPLTIAYFPIFDTFNASDSQREIVGIVFAATYWSNLFKDVLPDDAQNITIIVENECEQTYSYSVSGAVVTFLGEGRRHDPEYEKLQKGELEINITGRGTSVNQNYCPYTIQIYPTHASLAEYTTIRPVIYTSIVVIVFLFALLIFIAYDILVELRQRRVMKSATENQAIVASLFPQAVRDRMLNHNPTYPTTTGGGPDTRQHGNSLPPVPVLGTNGRTLGKINGQNGEPMMESHRNAPSGGHAAEPSPPVRKRSFAGDQIGSSGHVNDKPIADLFDNATVLFADIAGFTAWSSVREPTQVFTLLQTLYQAFDKVAKKIGVFKIETIGDCYVAVTGLPEPQDDHAIRMARFAREIVHRMNDLVGRLEVTLGPDTGDLQLRAGMHSGPVTAGVLRGEKSRFQLFGDTVNTAARMESTGIKNQIQCTEETAALIREGGKRTWLTQREDVVVAKGKGEMRTFWIATRGHSRYPSSVSTGHHRDGDSSGKNSSSSQNLDLMAGTFTDNQGKQKLRERCQSESSEKSGGTESTASDDENSSDRKSKYHTKKSKGKESDDRTRRLVNWHVDLLSRLLKKIIAERKACGIQKSAADASTEAVMWTGSDKAVVDEVADFISFPPPDPRALAISTSVDSIELPERVLPQLQDFVSTVASLYRDNAFHNFEHASHVTMCANKLFNRIIAPPDIRRSASELPRGSERYDAGGGDDDGKDDDTNGHDDNDGDLLSYTLRIKSSALTHFAFVLSAVIHDVDHTGMSNHELITQGSEIAMIYNNKSVAEQNSVDVAWELLMDSAYADLQRCIYQTAEEFKLFRQIVVNMVISTDIFDKDAKAARERRWQRAFGSARNDEPSKEHNLNKDELKNLRATIMLEHTMQASDVGHTMQHWHIFRKWNERLYQETMFAYLADRTRTDPSSVWYESEIKFYDGYVLLLAKKLYESHAFGPTANEYFKYALKNRAEWEAKGQHIVRDMASKHCRDELLNAMLQNVRRASLEHSQKSDGGVAA